MPSAAPRPHKVPRLESEPRKKPTMLFDPKPSPPSATPLRIADRSKNTTPSPSPSNNAVSQPQDGIKKLAIKNAKQRTSTGGDSFVQTSIGKLTNAVRCILSSTPQPTPDSLQSLYSTCEAVINYDIAAGQTLYDRLRMELERRAGSIRAVVRQGSPGEAWAALFDTEWQEFHAQTLMLRGIFLHLDRAFILPDPDLLSIWDLATDIFSRLLLQDAQVSTLLSESLNIIINHDRQDNTASTSLLQSILHSLAKASAKVYSDLFVTPFIDSTKVFYDQEANQLLQSLSPPNYIRHCDQRFNAEAERLDLTLIPTSPTSSFKNKVLTTVRQELFTNNIEEILMRGLGRMVDSENYDDLGLLYSLMTQGDLLEELKTEFTDYVKKTGTSLVSDESRDSEMIPTLLSFQKKVFTILKTSFENNRVLRKATGEAFQTFINSRQNKPAEMMAKFIDQKMRTGGKGMSEEELEEELNNVLVLFRWAQGKDMFEAFYKRDFAKRLLLNRSASSDAEKTMLLKLKEECGSQFTTNLETMAKDIDLSGDIMRAYKSSASVERDKDPFDLSVSVLTTGNWPNYEPAQLALPPDMVQALDRFKEFYRSKYSGRTLQWQHSLDQCTLVARFPKGKKELSVSLYQALILLLFNDVAEDQHIPFQEIVHRTQLDKKEAARTLQSLASGRVRVLTKHPKGRDVDESDTFTYNYAFKNEHYKIKVNAIQMKETVEEQKSTEERVLIDRQSHLQLAIVRILKARKTIKHQELVIDVISALKDRFKVETSEIKKAIDSLIDREYMQRKEGARAVYEYVA